MTEKAVDWKQVGELYTMEGTFLEVGTFTDINGETLPVSEKDLKQIIANVDSPVPMAIDHGPTPDIGFTTQLANLANSKGLFKGYSNDPSAMQNAILQGYSSVSPEIEVHTDNYGNSTMKLKRICFVKNPAIPNAKASIHRFAFSAPEVNVIMTPPQQQAQQPLNAPVQNPMGEWTNQATTYQQGVPGNNAPAFYQAYDNVTQASPGWNYTPPGGHVPMPNTINTVMQPQAILPDPQMTQILDAMKASNDTIATLKAELEALKNPKVEEPKTTETSTTPAETGISKEIIDEYARATQELGKLKAEKEEGMKVACNGIIADLKKLDVKAPDKLFTNLPIEARIEALNSFKASVVAQFVSNTPMNSPPHAPITAEGGTSQAQTENSISGVIGSLQLDNSPEYRDPEFLKQLQARIARKHKNIQI